MYIHIYICIYIYMEDIYVYTYIYVYIWRSFNLPLHLTDPLSRSEQNALRYNFREDTKHHHDS
jgi:hypothetical protein